MTHAVKMESLLDAFSFDELRDFDRRVREAGVTPEYVVEINRLENLAEREHRRLRGQLLSGDGAQVMQILKTLDVIDELEEVCDAFEKLAHAVEVISLKAT